MGGHGHPLPLAPCHAGRAVSDGSDGDASFNRVGNPGRVTPRARTALAPVGGEENQKAAQNVASSTNVSSLGNQPGTLIAGNHLHDNRGGSADLHLPLGTGLIDVRKHARILREAGYDGTITLEVFAEERHYLAFSRDVLRRLWNEP